MTNHVKNQHYVPRFLLRNFSTNNPNNIWCYDKQYNKIEDRSISNVASENYFYDKVINEKESSYEYMFANIESEVAPIISNLLLHKDLKQLEINDKEKVSLFLALQLTRTKEALNESNAFGDNFYNKIKDFLSEIKELENIKLEKNDSKEMWFSLIDDSKALSSILLQKVWMLCESNKMFYISDNPVVKQNTLNRNSVRGTLGLKSEGIEIYFPLSDSIVLCVFCEKYYKPLENLTSFCQPENIENLNSLQVINSTRFVFSSSNNFELVLDMIKNNQLGKSEIKFS